MSNLREEIYNKIVPEQDSNIKTEIEKRLNELNCLYCFDIKTVWDYRSKEHQTWSRLLFNNNNFYVSVCENCGKHEFLFDTNDTNQGNNSEYKRFQRNDKDVESRIRELKNVSKNTIKTYVNDFIKNEVIKYETNEEASYEVKADSFKQNITKINFSADVKKICEILSGILEANIGIPNINIINEIELSFSMESKNQTNEKVFYHSTDDNKFFTFILIKQNIKDKNGKLLGVFGGEMNLMEIECNYWIYRAKNSAGVDILIKTQQLAVNNELNLMKQIINSHYENKKIKK